MSRACTRHRPATLYQPPGEGDRFRGALQQLWRFPSHTSFRVTEPVVPLSDSMMGPPRKSVKRPVLGSDACAASVGERVAAHKVPAGWDWLAGIRGGSGGAASAPARCRRHGVNRTDFSGGPCCPGSGCCPELI